MARLARQPWWWIGVTLSLVGLGLHVGALHLGPLLLVQPLLVTGVVFALLLRAAWGRHRPPWRVLGWAILIAAALAAFLVAAGQPPARQGADAGAALLVVLVGCAVAAGAVVGASVAARCSRGAAGALLGAAAGVLFGLVAGLLKMLTATAGVSAVVTSWPLYAVIAVGGWALVLNQRGYQMAQLHCSMPVLNIVDPLAAIVFGAVVLHEDPAHGPGALAIEAAAAVAMLAGLVGLYWGEDQQQQPPPHPPTVHGAPLTRRPGQR